MLANLSRRSLCPERSLKLLRLRQSYSSIALDTSEESVSVAVEAQVRRRHRRQDEQDRNPQKNRRNDFKPPRYDARRLIPEGIFDRQGKVGYEKKARGTRIFRHRGENNIDRFDDLGKASRGISIERLAENSLDEMTKKSSLYPQGQFVKKLEELVISAGKSDLEGKLNIYKQAEAIFASQNDATYQDSTSFTTMIRLAVYAGEVQRALDLFAELRRHSVSPTIFTYRAILEGLSSPNIVAIDDFNTISQISEVFRMMLSDWKMAIAKLESGKSIELVSDEEEVTAMTEQFLLSRDTAHMEMIQLPGLFVKNCSNYLLFLLQVNMIKKARSILHLSHQLVTSEKAKLLIPHLPCILASRFLNTIAFQEMFFFGKMIISDIKIACGTIVNDLMIPETRQKIAKYYFPSINGKNDAIMAKKKEQYAVNTTLSSLLLALNKFRIPGRGKVAANALETIYADEYLASLPPLSDEVGLRPMFSLCRIERPELCLQVFDAALEHQKSLEYLNESKKIQSARREKRPNPGHVTSIWTTALDIATRCTDDTNKGFAILEQVKLFKRGQSRIRPESMPMKYTMSLFMKKLAEINDWKGGLRLLSYHLDDAKDLRREKNEVYILRFITHFLNLAVQTEKGLQEITSDDSVSDRPTVVALKYLVKEVKEEQYMWNWCRHIMINPASFETNMRPDELDFEPIMTAREFLSAVVLTCKLALGFNLESSQEVSVEICQDLLDRADKYLSTIQT